jgi:hypothetical protein
MGGVSVFLEAPDMVLVERYMGKRVDPQTGGKVALTPQNIASFRMGFYFHFIR